MTKSDILQDISLELSKSVKKHLQSIKELPVNDRNSIQNLISSFKILIDKAS
jgi:hypothetical protein